MKVNRKELLNAVVMVKSGVSENPVVEQSGDIVFSEGHIKSYNDEVSIMFPFETDIKGSVPAEEFIKYLNALKDDELDLEVTANELLITSKKSKAGFIFNPDIVLSFNEIEFDNNWLELPDNFIDAIKFSCFSTGTDQSKPVLSNISIDGDKAYSTDGFRMTRYNLSSEIEDTFLINRSLVPDISKINPIDYQINQNWVHLKNKKGVIFSFRVSSFKFPDCNDFLNKFDGEEIKLPLGFAEVLESVGVFSQKATQNDKDIEIVYEKNKVIIRAENLKGWAETEKRVKYSGEAFTMIVKFDFIADVATHRCVVKHDGGKSMLFVSEYYTHLMMLKFKKD